MKKYYRLFIMMFAVVFNTANIFASEFDFSYSGEMGEDFFWGTGRTETYDVAIRLSDPILRGSVIKGIKVGVPSGANIESPCVWLSSELNLVKEQGIYYNAPDIVSVEASIEEGYLTATFTEPYTVSGTVYAGYSFSLANTDFGGDAPVSLYPAINIDGLWLHSSKTVTKWKDFSEIRQGVSTMSVIMEGELGDFEYSVGVGSLKQFYGTPGEDLIIRANVVNNCRRKIGEVEVAYKLGDSDEVFLNCKPTSSIEGRFGATGEISFSLKSPNDVGTYPLDLRITKVNGIDNNVASSSGFTTLAVMSFVPVMRPLMEEYTGLWCGYCPRGYVALEEMNLRKGDLFVALSYHNSDPMDIFGNGNYPSSVPGYPYMVVNRDITCDPYFGLNNEQMGIEDLWEEMATQFTPADISVTLEKDSDNENCLIAESTVMFVGDVEGDYRIAYVLLADNLHNEEWLQANKYAYDENLGEYSDYWDIFTLESSSVSDIDYNDVVVYYDPKAILGVEGSLPETIKGNTPISHKYQFNLSDVKNVSGKNILDMSEHNLKAVAILFNAETGEVINCNKSAHVFNANGVSTILKDANVISTRWYTIDGIEVQNPSNGLFIKTDYMDNGQIRKGKVMK